MVLALGAKRRKRKPALVTEATSTDPDIGKGVAFSAVEPRDTMSYLRDSFGVVKWNQNTTYQGNQRPTPGFAGSLLKPSDTMIGMMLHTRMAQSW